MKSTRKHIYGSDTILHKVQTLNTLLIALILTLQPWVLAPVPTPGEFKAPEVVVEMGAEMGRPSPATLSQNENHSFQEGLRSPGFVDSMGLKEEVRRKRIQDLSKEEQDAGIFHDQGGSLSSESLKKISAAQILVNQNLDKINEQRIAGRLLQDAIRGKFFQGVRRGKIKKVEEYFKRAWSLSQGLPEKEQQQLSQIMRAAKRDIDRSKMFRKTWTRFIHRFVNRWFRPQRYIDQEAENSLRQIRTELIGILRKPQEREQTFDRFKKVNAILRLEDLQKAGYRLTFREMKLVKKIARLRDKSTTGDLFDELTEAERYLMNDITQKAEFHQRRMRAYSLYYQLSIFREQLKGSYEVDSKHGRWNLLDNIRQTLARIIQNSKFASWVEHSPEGDFLNKLEVMLNQKTASLESLRMLLPTSKRVLAEQMSPLREIEMYQKASFMLEVERGMTERLEGPLSNIKNAVNLDFNDVKQMEYLSKQYDQLLEKLQEEIQMRSSVGKAVPATTDIKRLMETHPPMEAKVIKLIRDKAKSLPGKTSEQDKKVFIIASNGRPEPGPESILSLAYERRIQKYTPKVKFGELVRMVSPNRSWIKSLSDEAPSGRSEFSKILDLDKASLVQLYDEIALSRSNLEKAEHELHMRADEWRKSHAGVRDDEQMRQDIKQALKLDFPESKLPEFPVDDLKIPEGPPPNPIQEEKFRMIIYGKTGPRLEHTVLEKLERIHNVRTLDPSEKELLAKIKHPGSIQYVMEDPGLRLKMFEYLRYADTQYPGRVDEFRNLANQLIHGKPLGELRPNELALISKLSREDRLHLATILSLSEQQLIEMQVPRFSEIYETLLRAGVRPIPKRGGSPENLLKFTETYHDWLIYVKQKQTQYLGDLKSSEKALSSFPIVAP